MTQDEIIEMARSIDPQSWAQQHPDDDEWCIKFAKLVAAKATDEAHARSNTSWTLMCNKMVEDERERIAKQWDGRMYGDCEDIDIGAAIRARGGV
jgi:hypothetical protein